FSFINLSIIVLLFSNPFPRVPFRDPGEKLPQMASTIFLAFLLLRCSAAPVEPAVVCSDDLSGLCLADEWNPCCQPSVDSTDEPPIFPNDLSEDEYVSDDEYAFGFLDIPVEFSLLPGTEDDPLLAPPLPTFSERPLKRMKLNPPFPEAPLSVSFNESPVLASDGSTHTLVDGPKGPPKTAPPEQVRQIRLERWREQSISRADTEVPYHPKTKEESLRKWQDKLDCWKRHVDPKNQKHSRFHKQLTYECPASSNPESA
ncbi:MAG: hypothetical protein SGCHY_005231, partial [Lobulomycetales sp.]